MKNEQQSQQEAEILAQLNSDDSAVVRAAAFEAGDLALQSAVGRLVEHFQNSSVGVQEAADYALRKIRGPQTVQAMLPLLSFDDVCIRNVAMDILRFVGIDDIATLTKHLRADDPDVRIFIADILGSTNSAMALAPLCDALLHDAEVNVRYQAAVSLGTLASIDAVESLRLAIHDEEWVQFAVMEALAKIKAESCVDILIQALETCSPLVASTVIDALGEINNVKAAPLLLNYLEKTSGPLRIKALKAIIRILGPNSLSLLGAKQLSALQAYMLAALNDDDEDTLKVVLSGLAYTGVSPAATRSVLKLVARTDPDKQQDMLHQELLCLVGIGYNEALEEALQDSNEMVRHMAVEACGNMEGRAGKYALKRHFDTMDLLGKQRAMEFLAQRGDDRDLPFFVKRLSSDEDPYVLGNTLRFLGITMHHLDSAGRMLELLNHPSPAVKEAALEACLALEDEATVRAIVAYREDEDPNMRKMAMYTMGYVGADLFAIELAAGVHDPNAEVRKVALEAIGYGWPFSQEKIDVLEICLHDTNREVRLCAVEQMGNHMEGPFIDLLLEALEDDDDWVKVRAMEALGASRVQRASPLLVQMLENASLLVQLKITEALGHIGDDVAFRALLSLMGHSTPEVQSSAAAAIARIRREEGNNS